MALKIPLHSNIRWGSAFKMLDQANTLCQVFLIISILFLFYVLILFKPIGLFLSSADEIFGPITTLRRENRVVKHLPWSAFKLADTDWQRVMDARDILGVRGVLCRYLE